MGLCWVVKVVYDELNNYIGEMITYKQMCEILGLKYYTGGKAKKLQIEDIFRYYDIEKIKTKYMIHDKYETPYTKEDKRKSIYYDDLETVILYALNQSTEDVVIWSISKALLMTNMVNSNYNLGRVNIEDSALALAVDKDYMYDFYNVSHSRFKRIFESALRKMESKALIDKKECTMVCKTVSEIEYNDVGEPVIGLNGNIVHKVRKVYAEATDSECMVINKIKDELLTQFDCASTTEVFMQKRWNAFRSEMNKQLRRRINADFCYKGYKLIKNNGKIDREITEMVSEIARMNVNSLTITSIKESGDVKLNRNIEDKDILIQYLIDSSTKVDIRKLIQNIIEQEREDSVLPF